MSKLTRVTASLNDEIKELFKEAEDEGELGALVYKLTEALCGFRRATHQLDDLSQRTLGAAVNEIMARVYRVAESYCRIMLEESERRSDK